MEINSFLKKHFALWPDRCGLNSGFTLVELMIYMGLLSIFLFIMTDLLASTLDIRLKSTGNSAVVMEGEFLRRRLEYDVHRATAILSPASGATSATFALTIGGVTHTYASSSGALILTVDGASAALTNNAVTVSNFAVSRIGNGNANDSLRFSITLSSVTQIRGVPAETRSENFTVASW